MQAATRANELKLKRITVRGRILHTMKTINVFLCIKEHTFRYSQTYKADMLCKRCWFESPHAAVDSDRDSGIRAMSHFWLNWAFTFSQFFKHFQEMKARARN